LSDLRAVLPALAMVITTVLTLSLIALYAAPVIDDDDMGTVLRVYGPRFLEKLIREFVEEHRGVVIEYSHIDDGECWKLVVSGIADLCISDIPLPKDVWRELGDKVLQIPLALKAIAVIYNVPEIPGDVHLNLTGEVIALIYRGEIRYWDDPRIAELNPAIADRLPHTEIVTVYRLDANEVTEVFTQFLHNVAPDLWPKELVGKVVDWPVDRVGKGVAVRNGEGMVSTIKRVEYSIGYVELSYAIKNNLQIAAIMNRKGFFTLPTAALRSSASHIYVLSYVPTSLQRDLDKALNATTYSGSGDVYPITVVTYVFIQRDFDGDRARVLRKLLEWLYCSDWSVYGYTPLFSTARELWLKAIEVSE